MLDKLRWGEIVGRAILGTLTFGSLAFALLARHDDKRDGAAKRMQE
jgi:hypothetical protein